VAASEDLGGDRPEGGEISCQNTRDREPTNDEHNRVARNGEEEIGYPGTEQRHCSMPPSLRLLVGVRALRVGTVSSSLAYPGLRAKSTKNLACGSIVFAVPRNRTGVIKRPDRCSLQLNGLPSNCPPKQAISKLFFSALAA
jgi:hypothetical protein